VSIVLRHPIDQSDETQLRLSDDNQGYRVEREEDGTFTMSPTHTAGGAKRGEAYYQLRLYSNAVGGKAFDSNTGFAIGPGKAVRSPDASWVSQPRIDAVAATAGIDGNFWPISPDVAIEIRSDTDPFSHTIAQAERFISRGSAFAVAIDPRTRDHREFGTPPPGLHLDFDAIIDA